MTVTRSPPSCVVTCTVALPSVVTAVIAYTRPIHTDKDGTHYNNNIQRSLLIWVYMCEQLLSKTWHTQLLPTKSNTPQLICCNCPTTYSLLKCSRMPVYVYVNGGVSNVGQLTDARWLVYKVVVCHWLLDESDSVTDDDKLTENSVETERVGPIQTDRATVWISGQAHLSYHLGSYGTNDCTSNVNW